VRATRELERALERAADGVFGQSELEGLPEPVATHASPHAQPRFTPPVDPWLWETDAVGQLRSEVA
jgi:hypothetical protein